MVKENRKLEITERGDFRIISAPAGLWQFQRLIDPRAPMDRPDRQTVSPWEDVGGPQEYEVAKGLLSAREAPVARKAVEKADG